MIWSMEDRMGAARERAEQAIRIPLGMASPLWLAFGAAAGVGAAWWWMTRWTQAVNLEAALGAAPAAVSVPVPVPAVAETAPAVEPAADPLPTSRVEAAQAATAPEPLPPPEPETPAKPAAVAKPAPQPAPKPAPELDDLTRLVGIGPKLADALAARGVTRFSELAAWTADDLATIDAALSLKGRAVRDAWVAQAKRFAAQVN
ncbi:MAG: hypothetical protein ACR2FH_03005 [Caulobacteraceae bacterium]